MAGGGGEKPAAALAPVYELAVPDFCKFFAFKRMRKKKGYALKTNRHYVAIYAEKRPFSA
jgi:hypothetical protein